MNQPGLTPQISVFLCFDTSAIVSSQYSPAILFTEFYSKVYLQYDLNIVLR